MYILSKKIWLHLKHFHRTKKFYFPFQIPEICKPKYISKHFVCSVGRASLHNLVNETNLVHNLFSVHFVSFIYNLYMLLTSPGPSSERITVFIRHLVFCYSVWLAGWCAGSCTPDTKFVSFTRILKHVCVQNITALVSG